MKWLYGTLGTLCALGFVYAVHQLQFRLIYPSNFPEDSRTSVDSPDSYDLPYEDVRLPTPDGEIIHIYLIINASASKTVLMLGPNAGNIGHALPLAQLFYQDLNTNVVLVSYRGYGFSTGSPSEVGLKVDADTVMAWMETHPKLVGSKIVLYGRSLGGAVAAYIASQKSPALSGLIVENTFTSIPALVPHILPVLRPFIPLITQRWNTDKVIQHITPTLPTLFMSGSKDELIPPSQFRHLFDLCSSKNKIWKAFPNGTHNDTIVQPGYWKDLKAFLDSF